FRCFISISVYPSRQNQDRRVGAAAYAAGRPALFRSLTALRGPFLPVEPELVAPVLAVVRPNHVLVVGLDAAGRERLLLRHLAAHDLLIALVALGRGDIDEDLGRVAQVLVQLVEVALVALAGERARVAHRELAREVQRVGHVAAERRAPERRRRLLEASL